MTLPEYDLNSNHFNDLWFWQNWPESSILFRDISGTWLSFFNWHLFYKYLGIEETQQETSKSNTFGKSDGLNENEVHSEPLEVNLQALDNFSKIIEKVVKQIKYVPVIQARDRTDFSKKGM